MRFFILILLFITQPLFASGHYFIYPEISLQFQKSAPKTIFYGEGLRVPVHLHYHLLRDRAWWELPAGSYLQIKSGPCPSLAWGTVNLGIGECYMDLVIPASTLMGKTVSGAVTYYVDGSTWDGPHKYVWRSKDYHYSTTPISVTVIPHPLSMNLIPIQYATANEPFVYNLKQAVRYYDENYNSGNKPEAIVSPQEIDGLHYDARTLSIVGKPQRIGTYTFTVGAKNKISIAQATEFKVIVSPRLKDKPVFRHAVSLLTALPNQNYKLNLLELLEENKGFMLNNQIHFSLVNIGQHADWLSVSDKEQTLLQGKVPAHLAGQEISISLIASSNTGGDSEPYTFKMPIAHDDTKKPILHAIDMDLKSGATFSKSLAEFVEDPAHDPELKLIVDKIEPNDSGLQLSVDKTDLYGSVPEDSEGKHYSVTLRASTAVGGASKPEMLSIYIPLSKEKKPRFKDGRPYLPPIYPGEPYFYDFAAHQEIFPKYDDYPYVVSFPDSYTPPAWLRLENNQLIADEVPEDVSSKLTMELVISNVPGGRSDTVFIRFLVVGLNKAKL